MLTHAQIWTALDRLAARSGLSASGLAKRAGLDPTTFNRSKRITPDGRARWPSTESIAKALAATGTNVDTFVELITDTARKPAHAIPVIGFAEAGRAGSFNEKGSPTGKAWDELPFPAIADEHAFALEISGDSLQPLYRDGDTIVVSPSSPVRRGDRIIVKLRNGELIAKELKRKTAKTVELKSLNSEHGERVLAIADVLWLARIVWASQ
jgi:phage repressor protein C with HTH and peptisase S24 domain